MKMFIVLAALVAIAAAAPQRQQQQQQDVFLVKETVHDNIGVDGYSYNYELSNGQAVEESAQLKTVPGEENPVLVKTGSFTFVDPVTNERFTVTYTADENGFHPVGAHLPVAN